ncbi:MAG: hypothetical protein EZS28_050925, partial [Streblomastix strix]
MTHRRGDSKSLPLFHADPFKSPSFSNMHNSENVRTGLSPRSAIFPKQSIDDNIFQVEDAFLIQPSDILSQAQTPHSNLKRTNSLSKLLQLIGTVSNQTPIEGKHSKKQKKVVQIHQDDESDSDDNQMKKQKRKRNGKSKVKNNEDEQMSTSDVQQFDTDFSDSDESSNDSSQIIDIEWSDDGDLEGIDFDKFFIMQDEDEDD